MSQVPAQCKQEIDVIFDLNNRLAVYMGKVRSLEAEISHIKYSKVNVIGLTRTAELQYENELKETRKRIAAIAKEKAQLHIDVSKWKDEAEDWRKKCGSLETRRIEAVTYWTQTYANLEAELRAVEKNHETCKKNLVVERQNVDELKWQIQNLEDKLERMENLHQEVTTQIKEKYEAKLEVVIHKAQTEYEDKLRELREQSELKIRKARKNIELVLEQKRAAHRAHVEGLETELEDCLLKLRDQECCNLHLEGELSTYRALLESEESRLKYLEYRVSGSSSRENTNGRGNVSVEVDTGGKYIKLYNRTDEAVAIGGWQLKHQAGNKEEMLYRFEGNLQLLPGATITVWSSDSGQVHSPPVNLVMMNQSWDTDGDLTTNLLNEDGELVAYTEKSTGYMHTVEGIITSSHYEEVSGTSQDAQKTFLQQRARDDVLSSDFQWSLFIAALTSYRHDTVLRPFPPAFTTGDSPTDVSTGGKDYQQLKKVAEELISMRHLTVDSFYTQHSERLIQLLYWVLSPRTFTLSTCKKECYFDIQSLTGQVSPVPAPNYIFQVNYTEAAESKFKLAQGDRELMYGYHGSRLDNFHSILHHGLQGHMNKNSFFGEGTYLSSELAVSMPYAPTGGAWKHSSLGDKLGCVAVCEIINDPSVKCQTKGTEAGSDRTRAHAPNSMGGEVPEKYYVVRNNEMMRVKYLLVYADTHIRHRRHGGLSWFRRHRFAVMICLYLLLLVVISLYSSKSAQQTIRRWVYR